MSVLRSGAFWLMCTMMWLLATPLLVDLIDTVNLTGVEGFLMAILPWCVLLALIAKTVTSFRGAEA